MSHLFEDDSALEELLNQQLDRRKQKTSTTRPSTSSRLPQTIRPSSSRVKLDSLSSTNAANDKQSLPTNQVATAAAVVSATSNPTQRANKLASWLASDSSSVPGMEKSSSQQQLERNYTAEDRPPPAESRMNLPIEGARKSSSVAEFVHSTASTSVNSKMLFDEDRLQEMSKQRLIQFILEEIRPNLLELSQMNERKVQQEVARLEQELADERDRQKTRADYQEQQIHLIEMKWQQLNKQLEARLEMSESELKALKEGQKLLIRELDEEHRKQLNQMNDNYQLRLNEEKQSHEEVLKRRDQLHRLELESKLKVNFEMDKLDKLFGEWQQMVQMTKDELNDQLKSIENLLKGQTIEVNATNTNLTKRSQQLIEQYVKFEHQNEQLERLSARLNDEILPQLSSAHKDNRSLSDKMSSNLDQLIDQNMSLQEKRDELDKFKQQLDVGKDDLNKEKFQLALDTNRLAFQEDKLANLVESNRRMESDFIDQKARLGDKESRLQALEISLESRSKKLSEQNYELHSMRKRLLSKQDDLTKMESRLNEEESRLKLEQVNLKEQAKKLNELRSRLRRESSQLSRLQGSLICSLCFGRLFNSNDENNNYDSTNLHDSLRRSHHYYLTCASGRHKPATGFHEDDSHHHHHHPNRNHLYQLTNSGTKIDDDDTDGTDLRQLESECKYVDMLPIRRELN